MITHTGILETEFVNHLIGALPRTRRQVNRPHESDAELVCLAGGLKIAITTDAIAEEIQLGLYDAYTAGWVVVMANLSDLAAVGADPIGLLLSETLPFDAGSDLCNALQQGIADACVAAKTAVLGGDTNRADRLHVGATALGLVAGRLLTRRGCAPGDLLFATRHLGTGNAFAATQLSGTTDGAPFRPYARITEGSLIRSFASSCMDTSDGAIATLDQLARVNGVGFSLAPSTDIVDGDALRVAAAFGIPPWMMLAGPHGEFELLFTVPPGDEARFRNAALREGWSPVRVGVTTTDERIRLRGADGGCVIDGAAVRNLAETSAGTLSTILAGLPNCLSVC